MKVWLRIVLAAALVHLAPAFAQALKKAVASPALQKEFDCFITKFHAGLKANDSAAVAGMTRLPYMNDTSIRNATQFRERFISPTSRRRTGRASSAARPSTIAMVKTMTVTSSSAAKTSSSSPRRLRGSFLRKSA